MEYRLFDYIIKIFEDERDKDFGAYIEEIPEVSAYGSTPAEAVRELESVFVSWVSVCKEYGDVIPQPYGKRRYGGKVLIRLPVSLHRELSEQAERDNTSLNQEILFCITAGLERRKCRKPA